MAKKSKPKFLRRTWNRYSKLGKKRKKKQKWRRPTGRDNKMREKRKGYPAVVSIGYRSEKKGRKIQKLIKNISEMKNLKKNEIAVLGKVGKKKKIEILKKAKEMKIEFQNINTDKFLKSIEKPKIKKTEAVENESKK